MLLQIAFQVPLVSYYMYIHLMQFLSNQLYESCLLLALWKLSPFDREAGHSHHTSFQPNLLPKCVATRKGLAAGAYRPFLGVRKSCSSQRRQGESVAAGPCRLAPGAIRRYWSILHKLREERRAYGCG